MPQSHKPGETAPDAARKPERPAPVLSRPVTAERLGRRRALEVQVEADEKERAAVAAALALLSLETLALRGTLEPHGGRGWRLAAALSAKLEQPCVTTLEAAPEEIEEEIERFWLPEDELAAYEAERAAKLELVEPNEIVVDLDVEEPEALPETLDLGEVAVEALALALDPYPRAPGAEELGAVIAGPPGVEPMTDEAAKPFAGLAALRERLDEKAEDPAPAAPKGKGKPDAG